MCLSHGQPHRSYGTICLGPPLLILRESVTALQSSQALCVNPAAGCGCCSGENMLLSFGREAENGYEQPQVPIRLRSPAQRETKAAAGPRSTPIADSAKGKSNRRSFDYAALRSG